MNCARFLTLAFLTCSVGVHSATAQELSRYRNYALESSLAAVVTTGGLRDADTRVLHARPAKIQEIEWRAPYVSSQSVLADPVHDVLFSFIDNQLYRIAVTYERDRMEGLTTEDVMQSLSVTYGTPVSMTAKPARGAGPANRPLDATVLARWENEASLVTLLRNTDSMRFQLVLVSKALDGRARVAITEALRLDAMDAPQREIERRKKEAEAASAKSEEARAINKAGFRP